jgi:hypothetical protein
MRSGTLLVALAALAVLATTSCDSPTEPTPACSYTLEPASMSFTSAGGPGSVAVTASHPSCAWSATVSASWISVTSGSQSTGSGSVSYAVEANPSAEARTATLAIGESRQTVSQLGRPPVTCTYEVTPLAATFSNTGGTGSLAVTTAAACGWTAASAADWVVVTGGASGTGPGVVAFSVEANRRPEERQAQLTVAGQVIPVKQAGEPPVCEYSVAPVQLNACLTSITLSTMITAPASCTWSAASAAGWLTLTSPSAGSGSATVTFTVSANYDAPREGRIEIRWPTETAGQNVRVAQAGCRYAVSVDSFSFAAAGGLGEFFVIQQSEPTECGGPLQDGCIWTVVASVPWITINTPGGKGDDRVRFSVAPNSDGQTRSGVITVRDRTITVVQAAAPNTGAR